MFKTLRLLLPAVIPSWRFFDIIAPSPRIEYCLLQTAQDTPDAWREFRPRPDHLPVHAMLKRMVWNPRWNETLFLVSCAERLMDNPTEHSCQEIANRIKNEHMETSGYFQFRLVFVSREDKRLEKQVAYISPSYALSAP